MAGRGIPITVKLPLLIGGLIVVGLAIVRKAMERMGGRSGVVSEPGGGSQFWIELPRAS